jgi:hypothetical protein
LIFIPATPRSIYTVHLDPNPHRIDAASFELNANNPSCGHTRTRPETRHQTQLCLLAMGHVEGGGNTGHLADGGQRRAPVCTPSTSTPTSKATYGMEIVAYCGLDPCLLWAHPPAVFQNYGSKAECHHQFSDALGHGLSAVCLPAFVSSNKETKTIRAAQRRKRGRGRWREGCCQSSPRLGLIDTGSATLREEASHENPIQSNPIPPPASIRVCVRDQHDSYTVPRVPHFPQSCPWPTDWPKHCISLPIRVSVPSFYVVISAIFPCRHQSLR